MGNVTFPAHMLQLVSHSLILLPVYSKFIAIDKFCLIISDPKMGNCAPKAPPQKSSFKPISDFTVRSDMATRRNRSQKLLAGERRQKRYTTLLVYSLEKSDDYELKQRRNTSV